MIKVNAKTKTARPNHFQQRHYTQHRIQSIDVAIDWQLPYELACALKYIDRYRYKHGTPLKQRADLYKAVDLMNHYLERWEALGDNSNAPH